MKDREDPQDSREKVKYQADMIRELLITELSKKFDKSEIPLNSVEYHTAYQLLRRYHEDSPKEELMSYVDSLLANGISYDSLVNECISKLIGDYYE